MVYLSHAAELGDARAMLAVGAALQGTFGRRAISAALRLYQRARRARFRARWRWRVLKGRGSLEGDGAGRRRRNARGLGTCRRRWRITRSDEPELL